MTTKCSNVAAAPSITVLSPNGGEVYQFGQQITVKWTSNNYSPTSPINISIGYSDTSIGFIGTYFETLATTTNTGSQLVTLPAVKDPYGSGKHYKIFVSNGSNPSNPISASVYDSSDNLFTIQTSTNTTCTINSFTASPTVVSSGDTATLTWSTSGCDTAYVYGSMVPVNGTKTTAPITDTTTFTLYAGTLPAGCPSFLGYSMTTGQSCSAGAVTSSAVVSTSINPIDQILPAGCTSTSGYSSVNGQPCNLPAGCMSSAGYSSTTGQPCSGGTVTTVSGCNGTVYSTTTGQLCPTNTSMSTQQTGAPVSLTLTRTLKLGTKGDDVKALQTILGIPADGIYGRGTVSSVKYWQSTHKLPADGAFGTQSNAKLNSGN